MSPHLPYSFIREYDAADCEQISNYEKFKSVDMYLYEIYF